MVLHSGRLYLLDRDLEAVRAGELRPQPLVIRVNAGDCLTIALSNRMETSPASFHLDSPTFDPQGSLGITLGFNPEQTVLPGERTRYRYYADSELGAVLIRGLSATCSTTPGRASTAL